MLYSEVFTKRFLACVRLSDSVQKLGYPTQVCNSVVVLVKVFVIDVILSGVSWARYERQGDESVDTVLTASYSQFKVASVVLGCKYLEGVTISNSAIWVCLIRL